MQHSPSADPLSKQWFGHPRGLSTLFFTEMWERFSYYGMRALLVLFLTASVMDGGVGFDPVQAGALYGMFTALVYLMNLPGGWVADRILGQRKAVFWGGLLIAFGNLTLAIPDTWSLYTGLGLIILGTGLLKPNISVIVGQLYSKGDPRRDSGFTIFYMGINLGAFIAPLICGWLAQAYGWRWGFVASGIGMLLGLAQYLATGKYLGEAGTHPHPSDPESSAKDRRNLAYALGGLAVITIALVLLTMQGMVTIVGISNGVGYALGAIALAFFAWLFLTGDWTVDERKRLYVIFLLFIGAAIFWSAFEQAGTTLNLFAQENTDRTVAGWIASLFGLADGVFPAPWFQSLNALFIMALAPVFAWLWIWLARRKKEPSLIGKFSFGLFFLGLGFVVMIWAAILVQGGSSVGPMWLVSTYMLHTIGELCLSPVGLSAMTKLAPDRVVSQMMGVWFLGASVGNYISGFMARFYGSVELPTLFGIVTAFALVGALIFALLVRPVKRMMATAESE